MTKILMHTHHQHVVQAAVTHVCVAKVTGDLEGAAV